MEREVSVKKLEKSLQKLRTEVEKLRAKKTKLQVEIEQAKHLLNRIEKRQAYRRNSRERTRTHRLIQYGAGLESQFNELSVLTDPEIYIFTEQLSLLPGVSELVEETIRNHQEGNI